MSNILDLTSENFQEILGENSQNKLVIIEFYSPNSPESQQQAPLVSAIASEYPEHLLLARLNCEAQQTLAQQLAQQIGIEAIPALVIIKASAPVDMLSGPQTDAQIREALSKHLPSPDDLILEQAKQALINGEMDKAYNFAKQAYEINPENARIKLVFADICLKIQKLEDAKALLSSIPMIEQDAYYTNLKAKLELALEALDSPEIKVLQDKVELEPDNFELKTQLAVQYNQVGRKEEALESLYIVLKKDLAFGEAKKMYLDVIATLPDGDALALKYRRKLYSMLY
ncbi:co-chaperone YbbN [Pseudoalteromonas sp. NBT06-2]|uniref:tetratricopeptide repeat protein n=1 Tax=Pseudoalteromonas sp. NBT06-2 TaxID=2025950 RepID=UPI000BA72A6F|nr:tetratricopeptide repeat protein [Pseudoalteromonas sp. NBT06-2]PAJ73075.1 co-chaperone YbbN [Pseudoalteromonas sp. NBT06-2]